MKRNELLVKDVQGRYTTSCILAEILKIDHASIVRTVNSLECCETFWQNNFRENLYSDGYGTTQKCIDISGPGFRRVAKELRNENNDEQIALFLKALRLN